MTPRRKKSNSYQRILAKAVQLVANAQEGERNDTLNSLAFILAGYVQRCRLDQEEVAQALIKAAEEAGLGEGEARSTIRSAFKGHKRKGKIEQKPAAPSVGGAGASEEKSDSASCGAEAEAVPGNSGEAVETSKGEAFVFTLWPSKDQPGRGQRSVATLEDIEYFLSTPVELPKALADALNGISIDETLQVPALLADTAPVLVSFQTSLSSVSATEGRLNLGLGVGVASKKGTAHDSPGAIARSGCLGTSLEGGKLPDDGELALGLHDDVLNELLFEAWWGGAFDGPLKGDIMGGAKAGLVAAIKDKFGLKLDEGDLQVGAEVDFLMPPIVIGCGESWPVWVQVGDAKLMIWVDISAGPLKGSGTLTAYLSMEAPLSFAVVEGPGGQTLSALLDGAPSIWWDIEVELGGVLAELKEALLVSVESELDKVVLQDIPAQALASITWPTIPLYTLHPSVPSGTALGLDGAGVKRLPGIAEVYGAVVQMKSE